MGLRSSSRPAHRLRRRALPGRGSVGIVDSVVARSVSLKPFFPDSAPWHGPELQPARVSTGITWLRNVNGYGADARSTSTTVETDAAACRAVMIALPSPTADTTPVLSTVATFGFDEIKVALPVRSPVYAFPVRDSRRSCCRLPCPAARCRREGAKAAPESAPSVSRAGGCGRQKEDDRTRDGSAPQNSSSIGWWP